MQRVELESERHAKDRVQIEVARLEAIVEARNREIQVAKTQGNRENSDALAALQSRMEARGSDWCCFCGFCVGGGRMVCVDLSVDGRRCLQRIEQSGKLWRLILPNGP